MYFLMAGLLSGLISGLGMGGGVILIVILTYITHYTQQGLQSINLIYYIPTAIFAIVIYFKNKNIDYKIALKIILWGIVPTIIAAIVANLIDTRYLRKIFAVYLIIIGAHIFIKSFKKLKVRSHF